MTVMVISGLVGAFLFLFLFWKKLKEDYASDMVFSTAFFVLIGVGISLVTSRYTNPTYWFWFAVFGVVVGTLIGVVRYNLKIYEVLEAEVYALLSWLGIIYISDLLANKNIYSSIGLVLTVALMVLYRFLDSRYKRFSWYKSGKVGFSSLTTLGVYFLTRALIAILVNDMLSFIGKYEILISGVVSSICFIAVYRLSRK